MKVLLILPPNLSYAPPLVLGFPLGLGYIASQLEAKKHEVKIIDACFDKLTMADVIQEMEEYKADVVGITVYTALSKNAVELADIAKQQGSLVVGGGPHATYDYQNLLDNYKFDYIIRGEGEIALPDLLAGKIKERVIHYPLLEDLDSLFLPAYHLVDFQKYIIPQLLPNAVSIMSSRGCSHRCAFCSQTHLNNRWRSRSPQSVISEIEFLLSKYKDIKSIQFFDDNFTLNKNRVRELCQLLIDRKLDKYMWNCLARVDQVDLEMLKLMKRAGCVRVHYGVESADEQVLENIHKRISLDKVEKAFALTKKANIESLAFFMVGNPGDSDATIKKTVKFAKKIKSSTTLWSITHVYPGTELANRYPDVNWVEYLYKPELTNFSPLTNPNVIVYEQEGLDREKLKKVQKKLLKIFLIHHTIRNFWAYLKHFLYSPKNAIRYVKFLTQ